MRGEIHMPALYSILAGDGFESNNVFLTLTCELCSKLICFISKWWYMAYITLTKLLDQHCVSDHNMGILLKTNVLHFQMVAYGLYNPN